MGESFSFRGNEAVGRAVKRGMTDLGWTFEPDASNADAVFTYFTSESNLEDAYFEDDGLIKLATPGTLVIDLSPASPTFARELAAIAAVNDLRPVEAPLVIVNPVADDALGARENLKCFMAGEQAECDAALPLLEAIAIDVVPTGGCGTAQLAKAAVTMQQAAQILAAIEADALFRIVREGATSVDRLEGEPRTLTWLSEAALACVVVDRFDGDFSIEMLMGDVLAAMTAADDVELILPQLEAMMHLLEILSVIGGIDMGPAGLSLLYRSDEECARYGLDWSLAEQYVNQSAHEHGYDGDYDDYDYGYDQDYPDEPLGYDGGFGGYSAN